jgi:hypothetical protein
MLEEAESRKQKAGGMLRGQGLGAGGQRAP